MGTKMRVIFEQLMNKDSAKHQDPTIVTSPASKEGTSSSNTKVVPPIIIVESMDNSSGGLNRYCKDLSVHALIGQIFLVGS